MTQEWKFSKYYPSVKFNFEELADGFQKFIELELFDPLDFDHSKNRNQRNAKKGDFTWIVNKAILAIATPISDIPYLKDFKSKNQGKHFIPLYI